MRTSLVAKIIVSLLILCPSIDCLAMEYEYPFGNNSLVKRVWTTRNGLPQNTVSSIAQTNDSYIWLATLGGIVRFDGVRFTNYETSGVEGHTTSRATTIATDLNGVAWLGTILGDVFRFDGKEFKRIVKLPDARIVAEIAFEEDKFWVLGEFTASTYDYEGNLIKSYIDRSDHLRVGKMRLDNNGTPWFSTSKGVATIKDGEFVLATQKGLPKNNDITGLTKNSKGEIYASTGDRIFKLNEDSVEDIYHSKIAPDGQKQFIYEILASDDDSIWFSDGELVTRISGETVQEFDFSEFLLSRIRSLYQDKEGTFWIGSDGGGLVQFILPRVEVFGHYEHGTKAMAPVRAVIQEKSGRIWIASKKLLSYHNSEYSEHAVSDRDSLPEPVSLAIDHEESLWVGTTGAIMKMIDGKLVDQEIGYVEPGNAMIFARDGTLWLGRTNSGLQSYKDGVKTSHLTEDGSPLMEVTSIYEAQNGGIWVGTNSGFKVLNDESFNEIQIPKGLQDVIIRDFCEDETGAMWIATYGNGLFRFKEGEFFQITKNEGLAENVASRILEDDYQNFWFLGNQSIYSVSIEKLNALADEKIEKLQVFKLNSDDGMPIDEGNGGHSPAGWKMADGKLWFPMVRGGVVIDPLSKSDVSPVVNIEEVKVDNVPVSKDAIINIKNRSDALEIQYTGLNFRNPGKINFYYQMKGVDSKWIEAGYQRKAVYPYLPSGNYRFAVKALSSDGVWSSDIATLHIQVESPFWRSWWFFFVGVLALAGVFYLVFYLRMKQIKRDQLIEKAFAEKLIHAHESERNRIATDLHDGLGQNLLVIKNWALQGIPTADQESVEVLSNISDTATDALNETRAIVNNLRPQSLINFGLTEAINEMLDQVSSAFGIRFDRKIDNIDGFLETREELSVYRVIQESINNIVKHSDSPRADIVIDNLPRQVRIMIRDYGVGVPEDVIVEVGSSDDGFGLSNMVRRIQLLGGTLSVKSTHGEGTTLKIIFEKYGS